MSRHRMRLVGLAVLAAAVLSGCTGKGSGVGTANPAPSHCNPTAGNAPTCEQDIRRLNEALGPALHGLLPPDAVVSSNLVLLDRPNATEVSFVPVPDQEGTKGYDAAMRVRADGRAGNLEIQVHPYTEMPESDNCPDQARLNEMAAKGMKQTRCDRHKAGDNVILVHSQTQPYGSGEFARMALEQMSVVAYRSDGIKVDVSQSPVVEKVPDDPAARQKAAENFLTVQQLEALALNPAFTIG